MNPDERAIGDLIERELAHARDTEPLAGFEERLLARLRERERGRRVVGVRTWVWGAAAAVAAAALVVAVFLAQHPQEPRPAQASSRPTAMPAERPAMAGNREASDEHVAANDDRVDTVPNLGSSSQSAVRRRPVRRAPDARIPGGTVSTERAARQPIFPARAPLSAQERLLLALASRPEDARALTDAQQRARELLAPIEPVKVEDIVIAPIEGGATR